MFDLIREALQLTESEFHVGQHVNWNSEGGRAHGQIKKVHTKPFKAKDYISHATPDNPVYEILSPSGHVAFHFGSALTKE